MRKAGKRVAVYASEFDTDTYALASYCDTIIMPENGDLLIPGAGLQMVFFAGTLEKLHMSADFVQVGKFKGAEEPYMRKSAEPGIPPADREAGGWDVPGDRFDDRDEPAEPDRGAGEKGD